jgi:hypothetical protein
MIPSPAAVELNHYKLFEAHHKAIGCSQLMPRHLGPKSPRVTNANHEINKYAQVLKGGLLSILNLTQPTMDLQV